MYYNEADRRVTERVQRPRRDFSDTRAAQTLMSFFVGAILGVAAGSIFESMNPELNGFLIAFVVGFLTSTLTGVLWRKRAERRDELRRKSILDHFARERGQK